MYVCVSVDECLYSMMGGDDRPGMYVTMCLSVLEKYVIFTCIVCVVCFCVSVNMF